MFVVYFGIILLNGTFLRFIDRLDSHWNSRATQQSISMSTTTDHHELRMSCQTANTIDLVWVITVLCLLYVGLVFDIVLCVGMFCRSFVNFLTLHLSVVDVIFRVATTGLWLKLLTTDSTDESKVPCKFLQTIDAMCGAAFFTTLFVIVRHYYRKTSLICEVQFSCRNACGVTIVVWIYAAVCSCPMIISVFSARYTEIPEVALSNITEALRSCNVPKLCDLQRDWSGKVSSTWYFCFGFLLPMFAIVVLFVMIARDPERETLRRSTSESHLINQETPQNDPVYKADKNVCRMLILFSVFGFLFWAPTSVIFMLRSYDVLDHISSDAVLYPVIIFEIFKFFNSLPNPFIFWCFMPSFRDKWRSACTCCKPSAKLVPTNHYGTTIVTPMFTSDSAV